MNVRSSSSRKDIVAVMLARAEACDQTGNSFHAEECREIAQHISRLRSVMYDVAHVAATLGSGSEGYLRGRFMSISNALNAAIGRQQSSHGNQYDDNGNVVKIDPLLPPE